MRVCGLCRQAFRANDPGSTCAVPADNLHGHMPGHYSACSECCAIYDPEGPASRYSSSHHAQPRIASGILEAVPAGLCGICKTFAREDDTMEAMRLYPFEAGFDVELFPHGECENHNHGFCTREDCGWRGPYEARCPKCSWLARRDQLDGEPGESVRACEWHGPYQEKCPRCGGKVIQREECYLACGECRRKYAPVILERLQRLGIAPKGLRPEQMAIQMFA